MSPDSFEIATRFRGPPDSGNGGYTCGRLAAFVEAEAVQVSLRLPPPLERPLTVERRGGGAVLLDGEALVAEAEPAELSIDLPAPVSPADAEAGVTRSPFLDPDGHAFPGCFVCGPERAPGDGLRIFAGPAAGEVWASPWTPDPSLADEGGTVSPEFAWAALDCPTGAVSANPGSDPPVVLARMTCRLSGRVEAGSPHLLQSWRIGWDGRKRHAGSALYDAAGNVLGAARALWIELRR